MSESAHHSVAKALSLDPLDCKTLETVLDEIKNEETKENVVSAIIQYGPQVIADRLLEASAPGEQQMNLLAECLKSDEFRSQVNAEKLVKRLLSFLAKNGELGDTSCANIELLGSNPATVKHIFRALSNVCYENDEAQNTVCENRGIELVGSFLKPVLRNSKVEQTAGEYKIDDSILICLIGCLFNVARKHNCLTPIRELELVPQMVEMLPDIPEAAANHAVNLLFNATEIAEFQKDLIAVVPSFLKAVGRQSDRSNEILEAQVEFLQTLFSEVSDAEKLEMYEAGLWEVLKTLAEKRTLKPAIDTIIVMLTDDECMKRMFDNGWGAPYLLLKEWLTNEIEDLRICAALAMGNFARGDANCIKLVNVDAVGLQLVTMISPTAGTNQNYAVLSALRNMLIPKECKSHLLDAGLLEKLLSLLPIENYSIAFKFLGCLRMAADRKPTTARELGTNSELIRSVVEFAKVELHEGVRSEAMRLLCWILRSNGAQPVFATIARAGGFEILVQMLLSEHSVMKNEAIRALSFLLYEKEEEEDIVVETADKVLPAMANNLVGVIEDTTLDHDLLENAVILVIFGSLKKKEYRNLLQRVLLGPLKRLDSRTEESNLKHKLFEAINILTDFLEE